MSKPLVIVESPAKAKTIGQILGRDYVVESSIGHIRDLPRNAAEIPASHKGEAWARMGVDVDNGFKAFYIIPQEKKKQVAKLKQLMKDASELYLATDEDREGESIAWHLHEVLNPRIPVKRMVFHEITRGAIQAAVQNPRDLDRRLVDAQEARRILDRLFGYEVSPVLWKKVMPGLSAGRVQSVATRILVERERARMRFRAASYWDIEGTFDILAETVAANGSIVAQLMQLDGVRLATGKDFDENGALRSEVQLLDEDEARALATALQPAGFKVRSVEEKPWRRSPSAPFMTSTLQQEASRKLRFGVHRTMQIAQRLYENGYITYMRTDSITLSETAVAAARKQAADMYGAEYVAEKPRVWHSKVKNAQEAHEAIRPAGESFRTPDDVQNELNSDEFKLYDLIWKRTIASEMADARGQTVQVRLGGTTSEAQPRDALFGASGKVISFPGFLRAYVEGADDPDAALENQEVILPAVAEGDDLRVVALEPKGHDTQPPARFTEASLVKTLEEMGVGRPSTYASIINTIEERGYVFKRGSALIPSWTAFAVVNLLEQHFNFLVDYEFTARMEDDLDGIAGGDKQAEPWLQSFYFGNGSPGLKKMVSENLGEIDARDINSVPIGKDADGNDIVLRVGRYGPYLQRGEDRASVPEDLAPDELTTERALDLLSQPSQERELGEDPDTKLKITARAGRYGPYVSMGDPESGEKPKTASLFKSMSLDTITLEDALQLLQLPRVIGADPADGEEIVALNGRYGPYIKKGSDSRSIESEEQLLTITLEDALKVLAEPKRRRGQRAAAGPLRELGPDPVSEKVIQVKEGRFGPYVTDGETNASLRKGDSVEEITTERAAELLADRRERGPATPKRGRKAKTAKPAAKKTAAKKPAAKKKAPPKKKAETQEP